MGNILHGVKEDNGSSRDQPQVSVVLDCFQAGAEESAPNQQPLGPHGGNGGGDAALALEFEATSMRRPPPLASAPITAIPRPRSSPGVHAPSAASCVTSDKWLVCPTKTFKANRAIAGGGRTDLSVKSLDDDPHHPPSSLPEGVQFVLNTLPVRAWCVGDGDGFTAYVETADVPQGVHVTVIDRYKSIGADSNNREILVCEYRIRMRGIDAPELQMEYGEESRNELVKLIEGKCAVIYVYGVDQYKRTVGDIYCDGVFIQEQVLKRGSAWHFEAYDKRPEFKQWQREAKAARLGLWSVDNPQKPWEWRRQRKTKNVNEDGIHQVEWRRKDNLSSETLPGLKKKYRESNKKLKSVVADNTKLNQQLRGLKMNNEESKKEMESVVAYNMKLDYQIHGLKKELENVGAENMELNDQVCDLKRVNQEAEIRATNWKSELERGVAEIMELKDQVQELKRENTKAENKARNLKEELENENKAFSRFDTIGTSVLFFGLAVLLLAPKFFEKKHVHSKNNSLLSFVKNIQQLVIR